MSSVGKTETMQLAPDAREDARRRLLSIRGHVDGILRMLEKPDTYCVEVLKQIRAVDGALDKVSEIVLQSHLAHHVINARQRGDDDRIVAELMELFKYR
ncbi:MAG: metal-sensitive transcriptional regulator [Pseudomonadota bacterium]|nr:metal-sensitive transcriptional regulator [Pseudomonadota bacterium]